MSGVQNLKFPLSIRNKTSPCAVKMVFYSVRCFDITAVDVVPGLTVLYAAGWFNLQQCFISYEIISQSQLLMGSNRPVFILVTKYLASYPRGLLKGASVIFIFRFTLFILGVL